MLDLEKVHVLEKISEELKKIRKILQTWYEIEKIKHNMEMRKK